MTDSNYAADAATLRKRVTFMAAAGWFVFHLFGLAVLSFADSASPLLAALIYDGLAALGFGLWHLAKRIYP